MRYTQDLSLFYELFNSLDRDLPQMIREIVPLKKQKVDVPPLPKPQVFIAYIGDEAKNEAIKLASALRKTGIGVIAAIGNKSLKAQLRQANTLGTPRTVIIGEQEIRSGSVILRDMTTAQQESIPLPQLQKAL